MCCTRKPKSNLCAVCHSSQRNPSQSVIKIRPTIHKPRRFLCFTTRNARHAYLANARSANGNAGSRR
ncbi:hypothetical protein T4E_9503 [Trichinella pseudospiralis]|uniref:Uncharacterized protein n=1 Tax=Trichinella pseudospiralis TaxID=6337 RepID=A0A0V0XE98_TRIPS|nr:hypothetical protein T4E_9503 [Trichinella pseudospiralis]